MHDHAVDLVAARVDHPAGSLGGDQVREVAERVGHAVDVDAAFLERLARVPGLEPAEFLAVAPQQVRGAPEHVGALTCRGARPGALSAVERAARGLHRDVHVLLVALGYLGEGLAVRRIEDFPHRPRDRVAPFSPRVNGATFLFLAFDSAVHGALLPSVAMPCRRVTTL